MDVQEVAVIDRMPPMIPLSSYVLQLRGLMADPTPPISPAAKSGGFAFMLRALSARNYRLFFLGQGVSLIGTWLSNMAASWLVNRITDDPQQSPRILGFVNFAALLPAFLLSPFAGVMVDRWRKHRLIVWTQAFSMLESFALAGLAFAVAGYGSKPPPHTVSVIIGWLIALSMFQGLVNAFDVPARQSLVVKLVDRREDLANAIALNSSMFNAARLVGPAIAGLLIWRVGEAWCFTIDGFSYLAVIVALLMMRVDEGDRPATRRHVWHEFREGLSYASRFTPIRTIITLLAAVSFTNTAITILMPRFATEVLQGDARTQGLLTSAIAVGALAGAVRLAARKSVVGLVGQMPWFTVMLGAGMMLFGLSTTRLLSLPGLVLVGFGTMTQMASGNTLLQTLVEDRMRGRVMSLFSMAFMGMMPLGSLAAGQVAAVIGPAKTVAGAGALSILAGLAFATRVPTLRRAIRPIYIEKGILPAQAAT
jgi:MFS family permease